MSNKPFDPVGQMDLDEELKNEAKKEKGLRKKNQKNDIMPNSDWNKAGSEVTPLKSIDDDNPSTEPENEFSSWETPKDFPPMEEANDDWSHDPDVSFTSPGEKGLEETFKPNGQNNPVNDSLELSKDDTYWSNSMKEEEKKEEPPKSKTPEKTKKIRRAQRERRKVKRPKSKSPKKMVDDEPIDFGIVSDSIKNDLSSKIAKIEQKKKEKEETTTSLNPKVKSSEFSETSKSETKNDNDIPFDYQPDKDLARFEQYAENEAKEREDAHRKRQEEDHERKEAEEYSFNHFGGKSEGVSYYEDEDPPPKHPKKKEKKEHEKKKEEEKKEKEESKKEETEHTFEFEKKMGEMGEEEFMTVTSGGGSWGDFMNKEMETPKTSTEITNEISQDSKGKPEETNSKANSKDEKDLADAEFVFGATQDEDHVGTSDSADVLVDYEPDTPDDGGGLPQFGTHTPPPEKKEEEEKEEDDPFAGDANMLDWNKEEGWEADAHTAQTEKEEQEAKRALREELEAKRREEERKREREEAEERRREAMRKERERVSGVKKTVKFDEYVKRVKVDKKKQQLVVNVNPQPKSQPKSETQPKSQPKERMPDDELRIRKEMEQEKRRREEEERKERERRERFMNKNRRGGGGGVSMISEIRRDVPRKKNSSERSPRKSNRRLNLGRGRGIPHPEEERNEPKHKPLPLRKKGRHIRKSLERTHGKEMKPKGEYFLSDWVFCGREDFAMLYLSKRKDPAPTPRDFARALFLSVRRRNVKFVKIIIEIHPSRARVEEIVTPLVVNTALYEPYYDETICAEIMQAVSLRLVEENPHIMQKINANKRASTFFHRRFSKRKDERRRDDR